MKEYVCITCGKTFFDTHYQKQGRKYCNMKCFPHKTWLGRKHTPETIEKMKMLALRTWSDPRIRRKRVKASRIEAKKRRGIKRKPCPEHVKKLLSTQRKGNKKSESIKRKMRNSWTDERRELYRKRMTEFMNSERREQAKYRVSKVKPWLYVDRKYIKRTRIELILAKILDGLKVKHEPQKFLYYFYVDEYVSEHRLVIEANGEYWHRREDVIKRDFSKRAYLEKRGERVLVLWESELEKEPDLCKQKISEAIKNSLIVDYPS